MSTKLQFYSEFAERTARQITGSYRSWTAFLATAARLYKYPYCNACHKAACAAAIAAGLHSKSCVSLNLQTSAGKGVG